VLARGRVLGILRLLTTEHREFSPQEINFVASLAEVSGIAIANATMYEKSKNEYDNMMKYLDGAVLEKE
jgi:GAF domain-containing protein